MQKDKTVILKVLVGSRAHNLHSKDSDYDYRAVYVLPTSDILSIGYKYKGTNWCEGEVDNTAYEIGHFLQLAKQCNPTILEVFKAPIVEATEDGKKLRELFPYVWTPERCFDAFVGYGINQRTKFLKKKDNRQNKFAVAYLRTLYHLAELIRTNDFNIKIPDGAFKDVLMRYKNGDYGIGEVVQHAEDIIEDIRIMMPQCKQEQDVKKLNDFLIDIRRRYW